MTEKENCVSVNNEDNKAVNNNMVVCLSLREWASANICFCSTFKLNNQFLSFYFLALLACWLFTEVALFSDLAEFLGLKSFANLRHLRTGRGVAAALALVLTPIGPSLRAELTTASFLVVGGAFWLAVLEAEMLD